MLLAGLNDQPYRATYPNANCIPAQGRAASLLHFRSPGMCQGWSHLNHRHRIRCRHDLTASRECDTEQSDRHRSPSGCLRLPETPGQARIRSNHPRPPILHESSRTRRRSTSGLQRPSCTGGKTTFKKTAFSPHFPAPTTSPAINSKERSRRVSMMPAGTCDSFIALDNRWITPLSWAFPRRNT